jgi:hypothetical protein
LAAALGVVFLVIFLGVVGAIALILRPSASLQGTRVRG